MTLPSSYLDYPKRRHGQDMDRHDWRLAKERARVELKDRAKLAAAIIVPCEFHPINPAKDPFNHPHGMITPYPDLRHFTTRDYGNRVGVFRILNVLKAVGVTATFPVSAALLTRARPLMDAIIEDGHEIACAGLHGDAIHHSGLPEEDERTMIAEARAAFDAAGLNPTVWMSPARQESFNTPDLLAEAGFTTVLDWETDQIPLAMRTAHGPLTALPVHNELDDFKLLIERKQAEEVWARQILEAKDFLKSEHERYGAQVLGLTLTPFVAGQPFRIPALESLIDGLARDEAVWCAGASKIVEAFEG
ncbi:MAG: polysaccharide deacetylase family protein [Pseudomonadota bacterium]